MKAKETISFSAIIKPTQAGIKFNGLDAGSEVTLVIPAVDAGNVARLIALAGNVFRVNIEPGEGDEKAFKNNDDDDDISVEITLENSMDEFVKDED